MNEYEGNWLSTLHVRQFHFLNPNPEEIVLGDIAHALALTCRYGGHCSRYYSVAEHSVRLARYMQGKDIIAALLHDAEEAYIPDIPRPIKAITPEIAEMGKKLRDFILIKFDATEANWGLIREMDNRLLRTEAEALGLFNNTWAYLGEPLDISLREFGWSPQLAEDKYLEAFNEQR